MCLYYTYNYFMSLDNYSKNQTTTTPEVRPWGPGALDRRAGIVREASHATEIYVMGEGLRIRPA